LKKIDDFGSSFPPDTLLEGARDPTRARADAAGHFRSALDCETAGISIFDQLGRLEYINPAFVYIYGLDRMHDLNSSGTVELRALVARACVFESDAGRCVTPSRRSSGSVEQFAVDLTKGRRLHVSHHVLPTGGRYTRHTLETGGTTDRSSLDELLSLQTLIDQVPDYLWVKDTQSRFIIANFALARDHGFACSADLIGLTDFDLHARDAAALFQLREREILATGEPMIDREEAVVDASGQGKWLSSTKMPLRNSMGEIVGLIGVARDITPRKTAEALGRRATELEAMSQQLNAALQRERQLNALQRQFVSMASHEFRTPLAIIDGAAQRLTRRRGDLDPAFVSEKVEQIRASVGRMVELMESILSAGRLEAGQIGISPQPCSLETILRKCCDRQQELAKDHRIALHLGPLPGQILADRSALEQVFTNLLSNAVKYSPGSPEIDVRAWTEAAMVHVAVKDHGIGIDDDDLPKMGGRYFRARSSSGIAGTGIGLNLVKQIIDLHGGHVDVQSKRGEGSTFTVSLPLAAKTGTTKQQQHDGESKDNS